jgi:hypothetical protein
MVRGPNNTWWVIDSDPSVNRIMTLEEWYESQRNIAKNNRLGLYISEASKFDPYPGTYEASLRRGSFFRDLLEYFKLRVVSSDHRFKRSCNQVYR